MSVAVRQEEPCGGERLHQGARGDQDHEGPEDPGDSLRGQHRRPSRPLHGIGQHQSWVYSKVVVLILFHVGSKNGVDLMCHTPRSRVVEYLFSS